MDDQKPPSNGSAIRSVTVRTRRKSRISGYLAGKPKPIKTARVDPTREKKRQLIWWLKWVFILPLWVYALVWLVIILIDFFKY